MELDFYDFMNSIFQKITETDFLWIFILTVEITAFLYYEVCKVCHYLCGIITKVLAFYSSSGFSSTFALNIT